MAHNNTMEQNTAKLEDVIRLKRTARGLSQEKMAKRLSVSASAVSGWETGSRVPAATLVPDLSALLEVDAEVMAGMVIAARG